MKIKKIIFIILDIVIIFTLLFILINGKNYKNSDSDKIKIVSSNFASYDFIRAILGDNNNIELTFLIGPGKDAHGYDPTAKDIITIQNADLFVYVGGEMENWVEAILDSIDNDIETICISQFVDTIEEQEVDGAKVNEEHEEDEDGAFDEHIWTSPANAIKMVETLTKAVMKLDNNNIYQENAKNYIEQIQDVDNQIKEVVNKRVRNRLIFGDRMPMQYFINYYGLEVSAAFSGCSTDIEPSATTIAYLENAIKQEKIPVILYIELNNGNIANTIAEDTKCKALQIQTLHNISLEDFNNGETWVSLMKRNIEVLKKALW